MAWRCPMALAGWESADVVPNVYDSSEGSMDVDV